MGLTPSERTLLLLLANGHTVARVAEEQNLPRATVVRYRANLYRKLGASTLPQAITGAIRSGEIARTDIVTPDPQMLLRWALDAEDRAGRYRSAWRSARRRSRNRDRIIAAHHAVAVAHAQRARDRHAAEQIWAIARTYAPQEGQ